MTATICNSAGSLEYLRLELSRLDALLHREVRRWQLADQDADDAFRGQYVSDVEANALLHRPLAASWGQTVTLAQEEEDVYAAALEQIQTQCDALVAEYGHRLCLVRLADVFELDDFERQTLLICLAPAFDLAYERLYGYLQDDVTRKRPTVNLVLNLLCPPGPERLQRLHHFANTAPLIKHKLLERITDHASSRLSPLNHALVIDETIAAWLLGSYQPPPQLGAHATLVPPADPIADQPPTETQSHIKNLLDSRPIMVCWGIDRTRQEEAAELLAGQAERALLKIDLAAVTAAGVAPAEALTLALRDARLTGAVACLVSWDACLKEDKVPPDLLNNLCDHPDAVIILGKNRWQAEGVERQRTLFWLEFPIPTYPERKTLWRYFLENHGAAVESLDVENIAGQFMLTTGKIRDIVASARDVAVQEQRPLQNEDIFAAARAHSSSRLAKLARKIEPRYDWDDIILPQDKIAVLRELVATVRARPKVLEEWQVGKKLASSSGVTVLFAGPPGTGKTMAAEVIAGDLGLDLYKIDLSTVISKYVGETEKNLEKIFDEAESSNAILFFDEADSIFGKRSEVRDAHDRYANIEVSYLLQRMEAYNGVTIMATNLRANLDEAFTRRLQFAVDFPFPEQPAERLKIWESLFPDTVPCAGDVDLTLMARRFKLAGGNIRNIIVNAAYLAAADGGQVTMSHLLHGSRRELQKMGRLVNEADLEF